MRHKKLVLLDVRPILEEGTDPFNAIMERLKTLNETEETLQIINSFEPIPLLTILEKKGYAHETERPDPGVVHTFITKTIGVTKDSAFDSDSKQLSFEELEIKFKDKMIEINVRDLEMPMPMVTILENIEQLKEGHALYVHHKKLPQYLIPELENRQFAFASKLFDENDIHLIIYKL